MANERPDEPLLPPHASYASVTDHISALVLHRPLHKGWLAGAFAGRYIAAYDQWVAFGLLLIIGGKMIVEAIRGGDDDEVAAPSVALYLGLALATSIDAAAAGITLPLVPAPTWLALVLIGSVTAACSLAGYLAGRAVGHKLGSSLEILGGMVLIAIGINMLIQAA